MPIYEYRCMSCGRTVELLQRVADPPATECSHCQGELEKLFSAPSFQFKGSGWYVTDYGQRGGGGKTPNDDAGAETTTSGETASKSGDKKSGGDSTASTSAGS